MDLVVIDMAWTPQRLCLPAARAWLRPFDRDSVLPPRVITLIKPHYEAASFGIPLPRGARLDDEAAQLVCARVIESFTSLGFRCITHARSPLPGGSAKNTEYLALLEPLANAPDTPAPDAPSR